MQIGVLKLILEIDLEFEGVDPTILWLVLIMLIRYLKLIFFYAFNKISYFS